MTPLAYDPRIQAQIWEGSGAEMQQDLIEYLQTIWCTHNACSVCAVCRAIARKEHHAIWWLSPEKNTYSKAECDAIAQKCSFMLDADEKYFIILQSAEVLSLAGANSLLKVLEEPSPGYHFIVCAERQRMLLPTIVSRCVVAYSSSDGASELAPSFLRYFKAPLMGEATQMIKACETAQITEQMTGALLDELLVYWKKQYQKVAAESQDAQRAYAMLHLLQDASKLLPMPGSAKLFWRNLFMKAAYL